MSNRLLDSADVHFTGKGDKEKVKRAVRKLKTRMQAVEKEMKEAQKVKTKKTEILSAK